MDKFMSKGKNLCGLSIADIYENHGGKSIDNRKAAKFADRKRAHVAFGHPASHHEYAYFFGVANKLRFELVPARATVARLLVDSEQSPHCFGGVYNIISALSGSDEFQFAAMIVSLVVAEPLLLEQRVLHEFKQIQTWILWPLSAFGSQIGQRTSSTGKVDRNK
jgi:hypothetical protein